MKRAFQIFLLSITVTIIPACESIFGGDLPCDVEDPVNDLAWLKQMKTFMEINLGPAGAEIIQYKYNDEIVFWVNNCYGCEDNLIEIYNCSGKVICKTGGIAGLNTCPDFLEEAKDKKVLFSNVEAD